MSSPLLELPPRLAASALGRPRAAIWLRRVVLVLAVAAVASAFVVGRSASDGPAGRGARRPVPGFGEATLKVLTVTPGSTLSPTEQCSLLADTPAQKARGLMGQRDLAGYASMVFRYTEDVDFLFYNRSVPIALTVAWFDRDGRWIGSRDLEPCPDMEGCPTIASPADFRFAVEVEKGGLDRLGLGPGSQIGFAEGC